MIKLMIDEQKKIVVHRCRRDGTLMICVLVCLSVATAIMSLSTLSAIRARRATLLTRQMRQTELLLDAGILRAAKQLTRSPEYAGEDWNPEDKTLAAYSPIVTIRVNPNLSNSSDLEVSVTAQLDSDTKNMNPSKYLITKRSHSFMHPVKNTKSLNANSTPE
ncbi:hypothetical protein OAL43_00880 [bacterium]|nr:hypothetical protein [bacterium]